jgi:hypothetical protein
MREEHRSNDPKKLLLYREVAELLTVLLRRKKFSRRKTQVDADQNQRPPAFICG